MRHLSRRALSLGRQRTAARHCVEGGPQQRFTRLSFVAGSRKTVRNGLGGEADFSYWQCYEAPDGPIAQLDRVTDFYSVGCRFESCWDRQAFGDRRARPGTASSQMAENRLSPDERRDIRGFPHL